MFSLFFTHHHQPFCSLVKNNRYLKSLPDDETRETLGASFNLTGISGKITNPDEMLIVTNKFKNTITQSR